jgi:superfamily I DNA/RNA helicase
MVNPETNSLLILYDDAQNLYGEQRTKKFSFKSVGIQAQGRTTIFKLNYRNTAQVLGVAYEFAAYVMTPTTGDDDQVVLVEPTSAGRQGPKPDLIRLPSFKHEVDYLAQRVQQLHERDIPWNEIAIIYRSNFMGDRIYNDFQQAHIWKRSSFIALYKSIVISNNPISSRRYNLRVDKMMVKQPYLQVKRLFPLLKYFVPI